MATLKTIVLHGRIPSKKNGKIMMCRGTRPILISNPAYQAWRTAAGWELKGQRPQKYTGNLIILKFWMPDNRRCDLSNKTESVMDLLVEHSVFADDCWQVTGHVLMSPMGISKEDPRVEILFTELSDGLNDLFRLRETKK